MLALDSFFFFFFFFLLLIHFYIYAFFERAVEIYTQCKHSMSSFANSVDDDQTALIRVYTVCQSFYETLSNRKTGLCQFQNWKSPWWHLMTAYLGQLIW